MKQILNFIKKEMVLCISLLLAFVSMAFVPLDHKYISYIDFHTLTILFSLMLITAGLRNLGVFSMIGSWLLKKTCTVQSLAIILVMLCFGFSMFITNDVALVTFVPFTVDVLMMAGLEKYMIRIIVLQTIASNLGSMLTPIGNPQNLYLFSISGMSLSHFIALMLPYTLLSFLGLLAACMILIDKKNVIIKVPFVRTLTATEQRQTIVYLFLFLLALTGVIHIISVYLVGVVILVMVVLMDYRMLRKPDYALLLTFLFLFVFIGNMKRIPEISHWLRSVSHIECLVMANANKRCSRKGWYLCASSSLRRRKWKTIWIAFPLRAYPFLSRKLKPFCRFYRGKTTLPSKPSGVAMMPLLPSTTNACRRWIFTVSSRRRF